MATAKVSSPELQSRVEHLEKQVAGLMITVNALYQKFGLAAMKIPRPDHLIQTEPATRIDTKAAQPTAPPRASSAVEPPDVPNVQDLATLQPFSYSPLNVEASEIRLISIRSCVTSTDPIRCELSTVSLPASLNQPNEPKFMPLSYTWGGLNKTEKIILNGKLFYVTKNLHKALLHFRSADPRSLSPYRVSASYSSAQVSKMVPNRWWIDAVCINQEDLDERKSQVNLMTRLYRMASVAHVWLGEEADDSNCAMELIRKLSLKASDKDQRDLIDRKEGQTHYLKGPGTIPEKIPDEPAPLPIDEIRRNYAAIVKLFKRDWFTRVWILQELALPRNVTFHCGDRICSWEEMLRVTVLLVYVVDEYKIPSLQEPLLADEGLLASPFQRAEQLFRLRNSARSMLSSKDPYLPFWTALAYAKSCNATDIRDKVFAVLPLVSPETTGLVADYQKQYTDIYKTAAVSLAAMRLDFLSACQYEEERNKDLPSWVPDFSRPWRYYPMILTVPPKPDLDSTEQLVATYIPEKSALKVQGYIIDILAEMCAFSLPKQASREDVKLLKGNWLQYIAKNDVDGPGRCGALDDLRYWSSGSGAYSPLYQGVYVGSKGDAYDLSIRALNRHLATSVDGNDFDKSNKLGWYRNFLMGRRFGKTKLGHCGVLPDAAEPGDVVCKFEGSELIYVLRRSNRNGWIVIGDSFFMDAFSDYSITHMRPKPILQEMDLI